MDNGEESQETIKEVDYEGQARLVGWVPKDEWNNDPDKWTDAETFMKRSEQNMPYMIKDRQKLYDEVVKLKQDNDELKTTTKELLEIHKNQIKEAKLSAYEKAKQEIHLQQREAVKEGDEKEWEKLEHKKAELEKKKPIDEPQDTSSNTPEADPHYQKFTKENTWYESDVELKYIANGVAQDLIQSGFSGNADQFYSTLKNKVMEIRPDKFKSNTPVNPFVESYEGNPSTNTNSKKHSQLPAEAKEAFKKLVKQGIYTEKERDEYAKEYFSL